MEIFLMIYLIIKHFIAFEQIVMLKEKKQEIISSQLFPVTIKISSLIQLPLLSKALNQRESKNKSRHQFKCSFVI